MYVYEHDRDKTNEFLLEIESSVSEKKHFHNCMEFVYVIEGSTIAHIDGEIYKLSSGQLCAISCFSTHYYEKTTNGKYFVCLIPRRFFREYEAVFDSNNFKNPIIDDVSPNPIFYVFKMLYEISHSRDIWGSNTNNSNNKYAETQLHYISSYLINLCINHCGLHERHRISSLVADAVRIIENNFKSDITISFVCKKLGCYQKNLSYHFKKTMNMSILDYIARTRVFEAARILSTNPNMTVEAVMLESGFQSSRSFLRHFKKYFGCTPTEYRNNSNKTE